MKITATIYHYELKGHYREFIGTSKEEIEVQQISEWRKGFCLCDQSHESWFPQYTQNAKCHRVFLVNEKLEAIYYCDSDYYMELYSLEKNVEAIPMKRVLGGYYVVYEGKCHCLGTYPGQDRDTEYAYSIKIKDIILENGEILSDKERIKFLKVNSIKEYTELGENIILCEDTLYRLSDYSFISKISSSLKIEGKFRNGLIKAYETNYFCNLYVVVYRKEIIHYIKDQVFEEVAEILGVSLAASTKKKQKKIKKTSEKRINITDLEVVTRIKNYYYVLEPRINVTISNFTEPFIVSILPQVSEFSKIFKKGHQWVEVSIDDLKTSYDRLIREHYPVNNFITDIKYIKPIVFHEKKCNLYKFKCRPYGYINLNGKFELDFDINHIKW